MALYSIQSERQLCEQLDDNLLFRWFLDMGKDKPSTLMPSDQDAHDLTSRVAVNAAPRRRSARG